LNAAARVDAAPAPGRGYGVDAEAAGDGRGRFAGVEARRVLWTTKLHSHAVNGRTKLTEPVTYEGATDWGGYEDHYFLAAYYPEERRLLRFVGATETDVGEIIVLGRRCRRQVSYNLFVGPKSIHLLGSLGHNLQEAIASAGSRSFRGRLLELLIVDATVHSHTTGGRSSCWTLGYPASSSTRSTSARFKP
jgi:hypothetical protein